MARPQLDHFLPQKKHPLLALSFFNLVPSCSVCNASVKGDKPISYTTHMNPYEVNNKHALIRFTYYPKSYEASIGLQNDIEINAVYNGAPGDLVLKSKIKGNISLFCINELYSHHTDVVQEIIRKRQISNDKYIDVLMNTFPNLNVSIAEAYRIAHGNFYNESEFHKRPLSKLTKDIAVETGLIFKSP